MDKKPQRIAKENKVAALQTLFHDNAAVLLMDYKGITVNEDTAFRRALREAGVQYMVTKNTFIKRAANEEGFTELDPFLEGTSSIAFSDDPVALAKIVSEFAKDHPVITVKAGLLEGKLLPAADVAALAKLPSREVLLSMVLAGMQSPMTGFAGALQGLLRNFVNVLDQVREQKESA
ncbi:MAG: 50S ribosomal protein L10 [Bacillota bacterium]|nr:50S ribosomal protein L10 [Bacillota bacterium]